MDWLIKMNEVLDYIEDHLETEIDYDRIAQISLCPSGLFQRMFSVIANMSLADYIRQRRLTCAGLELKSRQVSIMDLALKYGYESPDAFSFAFKRLHGVTPSQAKEEHVHLKLIPRLSFIMELKGNKIMNYKIVKKAAFSVVGVSLVTNQEKNIQEHTIPKFWTSLHQNGTSEALCKLAPHQPMLGVCYNEKSDGSFNYMVGVETKSNGSFETLKLPEATWAVFESIGPMPDSIMQVWRDIYQNFLPSSGYQHAGLPDFELYPTGDTSSQHYRCEVWIPVIVKKQS